MTACSLCIVLVNIHKYLTIVPDFVYLIIGVKTANQTSKKTFRFITTQHFLFSEISLQNLT